MKNHKVFVAVIAILALVGIGYWLAESKELVG